jgi:hypothetical protein
MASGCWCTPEPECKAMINERQSRALLFVERCGSINLAAYRRMFPHLSDETLRLDLVSLVRLGLLKKNRRTKGTYYATAKEKAK